MTLETTGVTLTAAAARTIARRLRVTALPRANVRHRRRDRDLRRHTRRRRPSRSPALPATTAGGAAPAPGSGEPPVKARPAGALHDGGATITWQPRESFIQYIDSGEGTSTSRGATGDPPTSRAAARPRSSTASTSRRPAAGATRPPARRGSTFTRHRRLPVLRPRDRPAGQRPRGRARRARLTRDLPDDRLRGHRRRQPARGRRDARRLQGRRQRRRQDVRLRADPGAVPPGAASSVFAGYYLPGDPFGWVSISFTTD